MNVDNLSEYYNNNKAKEGLKIVTKRQVLDLGNQKGFFEEYLVLGKEKEEKSSTLIDKNGNIVGELVSVNNLDKENDNQPGTLVQNSGKSIYDGVKKLDGEDPNKLPSL